MIQVENLNFTYPKATEQTLKNLSFSIERGEIFGFLGPSGAGKSTTQKILIGLLRDYRGEISVQGRDLRTWRADYYERIGVGFEIPNHYLKLTAREKLNLLPLPVRRRDRRSADSAGNGRFGPGGGGAGVAVFQGDEGSVGVCPRFAA